MKPLGLLAILLFTLSAYGQEPKMDKPTTLKTVLLEQFRSTHNKKDWFVPVNVALDGVTAEQANWKDNSGNHSIGQLAYHLLFWDSEQLAKFKGETPVKFSGNNEETFNNFDSKKWNDTLQHLDQVLTAWEKAIEAADDKKVAEWADTLQKINAHNAYHIGQIVYVRRLQGSWDASKGVK